MGGLHLKLANSENSRPQTIPVTCSQLLKLEQLTNKQINVANFLDKISVDEIKDRNKLDGLARAIAIIQSVWFTVESLGRVAQGLFLTTLELTTLGFVVAMTACSICWWRKPMDVSKPVVVTVPVDLPFIVAAAAAKGNKHTELHGRTPLSFLDRKEGYAGRAFHYYVHILRQLRVIPGSQIKAEENDCFASIQFLPFDFWFAWILGVGGLLYSAIFMSAWNYEFPTQMEQLLWRIASVYTLAAGVSAELVGGFYEFPAISFPLGQFAAKVTHLLVRQNGGEKQDEDAMFGLYNATEENLQRTRQSWLQRFLRNNSPDQDPDLEMPRKFSLPFTLICAFYCLSRLFILVEEFLELRALPPSAYRTVNYGPYSPIL